MKKVISSLPTKQELVKPVSLADRKLKGVETLCDGFTAPVLRRCSGNTDVNGVDNVDVLF